MWRLLQFCSHLVLVAVIWSAFTNDSGAATYTLTIQTNGSGSVNRNPTNSSYPGGSVVTITAVPSQGWYFSAWTGDESGTANPLNVTMTSNKVVTANFQMIPSYTLTLSTQGMGSITLNPPGGSYLSNSIVNATATPAVGWVFANWAGDAAGNANPLSITMNSNKTVVGIFAQPPVIDVPPTNVTAEVGATVNFNVHATGTAPLYYQWWFNGAKLSGATETNLTLSNVQLAQEGIYGITVTNGSGTASNWARLTITNGCTGSNVVTVATEEALRNAINIGGLVRLCFNGTITLTGSVAITHHVTLDAHDRTVVITGNNAVRLFSVSPGVTFSVTNLVMANGRHVGQDGANAGEQPAQDGFPGEGGAILNNGGTVQLISCTLVSNSVLAGKAGAAAFPFPNNGIGGEGRGGAILVRDGSLLLDSVNLLNNSAEGGAGVPGGIGTPSGTGGNGLGGAIYSTNGSIVVLNSIVRSNMCIAPGGGNGAAARGGAVWQTGGSLTCSNSHLLENAALGLNGSNNEPKPSAAYGGALASLAGTANLMGCRIGSNLARGGNRGFQALDHLGIGEAHGGGVFSTGTFLASESSFFGNRALAGNSLQANIDGRGGALYNAGTGVVDRCSFTSNTAIGGGASSGGTRGGQGLGGGIYNLSQLTMTNCTSALNLAQGGYGVSFGGAGDGLGGGVYNNGVFRAVNATIASNSVVGGATPGDPGFSAGANVAADSGTLSLQNSIIAYPGSSSNAWGTITDAGFNISSDGSANFNSGSSFNFTDPLLFPPGNNGGPTLTLALHPDSPAVDTGTAAGAPSKDQRGFARPAGAGFDMGAYERQNASSQSPVLQLTRDGSALKLSFQAQANVTYVLQYSTTLTSWTDMETIGPFPNASQVNRTIPLNGPSLRFYRLFIP